jgi:hypothetical protein
MYIFRNKEELHAITSAKRLTGKNKALSEVRSFRREPLVETEGPEFEAARDMRENLFAVYYVPYRIFICLWSFKICRYHSINMHNVRCQ